MSDPGTLMGHLTELTGSLDEASKALYKLQRDLDEVTEEYEDSFNDRLCALVDQHEADGKKLPGEDVRNALVTRQLRLEHGDTYGRYRRLKAELDRGERRCKRIEKQISSYQSQLSFLKTEAQAVGA
jgi:predicted  nucleic acid-binding Zn-ribbon protein